MHGALMENWRGLHACMAHSGDKEGIACMHCHNVMREGRQHACMAQS